MLTPKATNQKSNPSPGSPNKLSSAPVIPTGKPCHPPQRLVIPTGASHSRREWEAEWRDLLFLAIPKKHLSRGAQSKPVFGLGGDSDSQYPTLDAGHRMPQTGNGLYQGTPLGVPHHAVRNVEERRFSAAVRSQNEPCHSEPGQRPGEEPAADFAGERENRDHKPGRARLPVVPIRISEE